MELQVNFNKVINIFEINHLNVDIYILKQCDIPEVIDL